MFHICDIYMLGIFKKTTAVNKYCVSINEFEMDVNASDYSKQNNMTKC